MKGKWKTSTTSVCDKARLEREIEGSGDEGESLVLYWSAEEWINPWKYKNQNNDQLRNPHLENVQRKVELSVHSSKVPVDPLRLESRPASEIYLFPPRSPLRRRPGANHPSVISWPQIEREHAGW